jgi:hypothetical protein
MEVAELIRGLGGQRAVAALLGLGKSAVGMWVTRGAIPREYHLILWRMALEAGLPWEPPGGDTIRGKLAASPPNSRAA